MFDSVRKEVKVTEFTRGELTINEEALHYRIYKWYYNQSGENIPQQENLCRYIRTVIFWSPLVWFFVAPLYKWVRPWMAVFFLGMMMGAVATFPLLLQLKPTTEYIIFFSGMSAYLVIPLVLVLYLAKDDRKDGAFWVVLILSPFVGIPFLIVIGVVVLFGCIYSTDSAKLVRTHVKSRKARVCPLIILPGSEGNASDQSISGFD